MFLEKFFLNKLVLFCWASLTGILFAFVWTQYESTINRTLNYYHVTPSQFDYHGQYIEYLRKQGLKSVRLHHNSSRTHTEDTWLFQQVPILCVILSKRLKSSQAVKNTWAKHCNRAIYFGPFDDEKVPVNKVTDKGDWPLLCTALKSAYKGYGNEFNWTLVVDDETFVVVENVRYLVASLDPQVPSYMGHTFSAFSGQYNILDAGFVVSNSALAAFNNVVNDGCVVESSWRASEKIFGSIMKSAGIIPRDTRDVGRKAKFLSLNLDKLLIPGAIPFFSRYYSDSVHRSPEGSGCCSDFAITFHGIPYTRMYMLEYLTYHLKPITMQRWRSIYEPDRPEISSSPANAPKSNKKHESAATKKVPIGKASVLELKSYQGSHARLKRVSVKKSIARKLAVKNRDRNEVPPSNKYMNESTMSSASWLPMKRLPLTVKNQIPNNDDFMNSIFRDLENEGDFENNYL